jgi:hypothetical protein
VLVVVVVEMRTVGFGLEINAAVGAAVTGTMREYSSMRLSVA